MTDSDNSNEMLPDELQLLKNRARIMGISFSNNISLDTLRERVAAHMAGLSKPEEKSTVEPEDKFKPKAMGVNEEVNPFEESQPKPGKKLTLRQHLHNTQMKLVRLRITNLDPKKKDLPGEIFTVANEHLGTVRKFVPYGEAAEEGYHVPYCIYKQLKRRKFLNIRVTKGKTSHQLHVDSKYVSEFALEVLPPLTQVELQKLALAQAAEGAIES